jgi:hypothetical protein
MEFEQIKQHEGREGKKQAVQQPTMDALGIAMDEESEGKKTTNKFRIVLEEVVGNKNSVMKQRSMQQERTIAVETVAEDATTERFNENQTTAVFAGNRVGGPNVVSCGGAET